MEHRSGISKNARTILTLSENEIFNLIPQAVCVFDMDGLLQKYNERAVAIWGRRPAIADGNERFSGALKLYTIDEVELPHDESPVANCIKNCQAQNDVELIMERPDQSRLIVRMTISPIIDKKGR